MKKLLFVFLILFPTLLFCQTSAVTATITDSDSQTWNNGTYKIEFVGLSGVSQYYWNGTLMTNAQMTYSGTMNSSGVLTKSIPDNGYIAPSGTQWKFTICPNASVPCSTVITTVTGGSPDLSSVLSAGVKAPRINAGIGQYAYSTTEVNSPATVGLTFYNVTANALYVWNGTSWAGIVGGSGITSINGDTTSAQVITGTGGASVTTNSGTTTIQAGPGLVNGGVIVNHATGSPTPYDAASNTNAARGTALLTALSTLASGDTVILSCGNPTSVLYDLSTSLLPSLSGLSNITITSVCDNPYQAQIKTTTCAGSNYLLNTNGTTNLLTHGIGYITPTTSCLTAAIGGDTTAATTNFNFYNIYAIGQADTIVWRNGGTQVNTVTGSNSTLVSDDDQFAGLDCSTGAAPNNSIYSFSNITSINTGAVTGSHAYQMNQAGCNSAGTAVLIVNRPYWNLTPSGSNHTWGVYTAGGAKAYVTNVNPYSTRNSDSGGADIANANPGVGAIYGSLYLDSSVLALNNNSPTLTGLGHNNDSTSDFGVLFNFGTAANKPGTCSIGQLYFATDATAGQNLYYCTASNIWSAQVNGLPTEADGQILAGISGAWTATRTPTLGDASHSGTITMYNGASGTTTLLGSKATSNNSFYLPAAVFTNGDMGYCVVTLSQCIWTDTGYAYNAIPWANLSGHQAGVVADISGQAIAPSTVTLASSTGLQRVGTNTTGLIIAAPITAADSGSDGTAYVVSPTGCSSTLTAGYTTVTFEAAHTNTITNPTLNFCSSGTKTIVRGNSETALVVGDIVTTAYQSYVWDGTDWVIQNPAYVPWSIIFNSVAGQTASQFIGTAGVNNTETLVQSTVDKAGILLSCSFSSSAALTSTQTMALTLNKNASGCNITKTFSNGSGQNLQDTSHSCAVVQGDLLDVANVATNTPTSSHYSVTCSGYRLP